MTSTQRVDLIGFVPAARAAGRRGAAGILAGTFWLQVAAVLAGARRLADAGPGDVAAAVAAVAVSGALAAWLQMRPRSVAARRADCLVARAGARAAVLGVVGLVAASILAPVVAPRDPLAFERPARTRYAPPSWEHPLGTDRLGRDAWSRLVHGARRSLAIAVAAVALSTLLALAAGLATAARRRWPDRVVARLTDGMLAFPRILFVLAVVALFPPSLGTLVVAIAATSWMRTARLVRAETRRLLGSGFVLAAEAAGAHRARVLVRHVLPNLASPVVVAATMQLGAVVLLEASLAFLGLGIRPPTPSWGAMVARSRDALTTAWWVPAAPALAVTLTALAFNVLGDALRDALDVRAAIGPRRDERLGLPEDGPSTYDPKRR